MTLQITCGYLSARRVLKWRVWSHLARWKFGKKKQEKPTNPNAEHIKDHKKYNHEKCTLQSVECKCKVIINFVECMKCTKCRLWNVKSQVCSVKVLYASIPATQSTTCFLHRRQSNHSQTSQRGERLTKKKTLQYWCIKASATYFSQICLVDCRGMWGPKSMWHVRLECNVSLLWCKCKCWV